MMITDLYASGKIIGTALFEELEHELDEKIADTVFLYFGKLGHDSLMRKVEDKPKLTAFFQERLQAMRRIKDNLENVTDEDTERYHAWCPMPGLQSSGKAFSEETTKYTAWAIDLLSPQPALQPKISEIVEFEQFWTRHTIIVRKGKYYPWHQVVASWRESQLEKRIWGLFHHVRHKIETEGYQPDDEIAFTSFKSTNDLEPRRPFKRHLIKQMLKIIFVEHLRLFDGDTDLNSTIIKPTYKSLYKTFNKDITIGQTFLYFTHNWEKIQSDQHPFLVTCKWLKTCRVPREHRANLFVDLYHASKEPAQFDTEQNALFSDLGKIKFASLYAHIFAIKAKINIDEFDLINAERRMLKLMKDVGDSFADECETFLQEFGSGHSSYMMHTVLDALENTCCQAEARAKLMSSVHKVADEMGEKIKDLGIIAASSHFDIELEELTSEHKEFLTRLKTFNLSSEQRILILLESLSFKPEEGRKLTVAEHLDLLQEIQTYTNETLPEGFAFDFLMLHYMTLTRKEKFDQLKLLRDEVVLNTLEDFTIFNTSTIFRTSHDALRIRTPDNNPRFYISIQRFQQRLKAVLEQIQSPFLPIPNFSADPIRKDTPSQKTPLPYELKCVGSRKLEFALPVKEYVVKAKLKSDDMYYDSRFPDLMDLMFQHLWIEEDVGRLPWRPEAVPRFDLDTLEFAYFVQFYPPLVHYLAQSPYYGHFFGTTHETDTLYSLLEKLNTFFRDFNNYEDYSSLVSLFIFLKTIKVETRKAKLQFQIGQDLDEYRKSLVQDLKKTRSDFLNYLINGTIEHRDETPLSKRKFIADALHRGTEMVRNCPFPPSVAQATRNVMRNWPKLSLSHFPVLEYTTTDRLELIQCELVEDAETVHGLYFKKKESTVLYFERALRDFPSEHADETAYDGALKKYPEETLQLEGSLITRLVHSISINGEFDTKEGSNKKYLKLIILDLKRCSSISINGAQFGQKHSAYEIYEACLKGFNGNEVLTQHALILATQAAIATLSTHANRFRNLALDIDINSHSTNVSIQTNAKEKVEIQHNVSWQTASVTSPQKNPWYMDSTLTFSIDPKDLEEGDGKGATVTATYSKFYKSMWSSVRKR